MHDNSSPLLLIFVLLAVVVGLGLKFAKCSGADHEAAEREFRTWARSLKLEHEAVSCNGHDGDGDGYVSCTYTAGGQPHTVECAGAYNMQRGCREPKVRVPAR